jgi:hypothetical protein
MNHLLKTTCHPKHHRYSAPVIFSRCCFYILCLLAISSATIKAQIDPEKRRIIQLGYNQYLEGRGPIAGYGFVYYNRPNFYATNMTLRLAVAPIYLDAELGFSEQFGPNTDIAIGMAGGGFAHSYSEVRGGRYLRGESFRGHGGEVSASLYHRFNPDALIPLWLILRGTGSLSVFERESETDPLFQVPSDLTKFHLRTGLRFGGQEPLLTAPLAMELSIWHESQFRAANGLYGFLGDREVEPHSHLIWGRGLLKYTFEPSMQWMEFRLIAGTSINADRFSAYRLGGDLPFASEFPLAIPGYYWQEISAAHFGLLNAQYSIPLNHSKTIRLNPSAAIAAVGYLPGQEQAGNWHSGAGVALTYLSPSYSWLISLVYGHGFNAIRDDSRGANSIGIRFQYDFDAKTRRFLTPFDPAVDPARSRGGERWLFR